MLRRTLFLLLAAGCSSATGSPGAREGAGGAGGAGGEGAREGIEGRGGESGAPGGGGAGGDGGDGGAAGTGPEPELDAGAEVDAAELVDAGVEGTDGAAADVGPVDPEELAAACEDVLVTAVTWCFHREEQHERALAEATCGLRCIPADLAACRGAYIRETCDGFPAVLPNTPPPECACGPPVSPRSAIEEACLVAGGYWDARCPEPPEECPLTCVPDDLRNCARRWHGQHYNCRADAEWLGAQCLACLRVRP